MSDEGKNQLIFHLAVAVRRLLITADKHKSAAKFAKAVLADADKMLSAHEAPK